jgi:hypothetical protein
MPEMKNPESVDHQIPSAMPKQYNFAPGPEHNTKVNPLKQYFRRPAIHLRLLSGTNFYKPNEVNYPPTGELPVFPMTAIDEITAKTPDAAFNGTAVADIIKSCIPSIEDPWSITTVDLDSILVAIRLSSVGEIMEIMSRCPKCENETEYAINLVNVLQSLVSGDYNKPLVIDSLEIKFKPLRYEMINEIAQKQYTIQKTIRNASDMEDDVEKSSALQASLLKEINQLTLGIVLASIEWIRTPDAVVTEPEYIAEFLQNCQKNDFDAMSKHGVSLREPSQIKPVNLKCTECEHEYEQAYTVNPSDFFA